jgi:dolichyl-phosphate beta-glucosyltransferase
MSSDAAPRLSVVIPAFNEENRLPATLDDVLAYLGRQAYPSEVIVVDDGSHDDTRGVVEKRAGGTVPLRVLAHPDGANHGKGATVRLGFGAARGEYSLFMDADNSTTLDHIERFWPFFDSDYDVVIGSRDVAGADVAVRQPWYKELAGNVGNWIIRFLAVPGIYDTQAGFKMFSRRCLTAILPALTIDRWGFDVELLVSARRHGFRIKEMPIRWVNAPNSKVRATTYLEVLADVWRVRRNLRDGLYDRRGG